MVTRSSTFQKLFRDIPKFRLKQISQALFDPAISGWNDITTLPKELREELSAVPWVSYVHSHVLESRKKDTFKALLTLEDGAKIETVLMENRRKQWTICVSSQVGCAMGCMFCATGKMGFKRNLTADEIVDQYRFWMYFLTKRLDLPQRISNIVFMGMGEPLNNYDGVKESVRTLLASTDLGPTRITVSTVGVLPSLQKLLTDPEWPNTRIALSLHSADPITRKAIVPTSFEKFIPDLKAWISEYSKKFGNRRRHLTFEYVMLHDINDTPKHAELLAQMSALLGHIKINLIPYNFTGETFKCSSPEHIKRFKNILETCGATVTVRKTMGDDIAAACGQLITLDAKKNG